MGNIQAEKHLANSTEYNEAIDKMFQAGVLGTDRSKALERLKIANKVAIGVSIVGVTLGMSLMMFPEMKFISMVIKSICLWLCVWLVITNRGLFTFRPRSKDPHPSLFYALFWPTIVGCWTAYFTMPNYANWMIPVLEIIVLGVLINALLIYLDKGLSAKKRFYRNLFLFIGIPYAFMVIHYFNVSLDKNPINSIEVKVLSKTKELNHYLLLEPSDSVPIGRKIKLEFIDWENINVGDFVTIELYKGALGNSWFKIKNNRTKN